MFKSTLVHFGSLRFTSVYLSSLEFPLVHLGSFGLIWVHLGSLMFTWVNIGDIGSIHEYISSISRDPIISNREEKEEDGQLE